MDVTDGQLLERCRAGDRSAWEELVHRHTGRLLRIARSRGGLDPAAADDVVQTGWRNLIEYLHRIDDPQSVGGWLATVVQREAVRVSKGQRRLPPREFAAPTPAAVDEHLLVRERVASVRAALAQIRDECRDLLLMLFAEPKPSYSEIATAIGRPIGSIGPTRARCLEEMRSLVEHDRMYQSEPGGP